MALVVTLSFLVACFTALDLFFEAEVSPVSPDSEFPDYNIF